MKHKEIGNRLTMLLKLMRLKNYEFAKKFNISNASWARYKSGDRLPDPQFLLDLCQAKVNLNWVMTGEGSMQITKDFDGWIKEKLDERIKVIDAKTGLVQTETIDYTRTAILPISGFIAAGPREDITDMRNFGETIEVPRSLIPGGDSKYLAFKVDGRSMEPNIMHDDIIIVKQTIDWEYADGKVCVLRSSDGATLKKVELDPVNKRIILQPFNIDFNVQIIDEFQSLETFLIGVLSLQLRIFEVD